jgi:hypothetical protein
MQLDFQKFTRKMLNLRSVNLSLGILQGCEMEWKYPRWEAEHTLTASFRRIDGRKEDESWAVHIRCFPTIQGVNYGKEGKNELGTAQNTTWPFCRGTFIVPQPFFGTTPI